MSRYTAEINIERFEQLLKLETDADRRRILTQLLADERQKLKVALE